MTTSGGRGRGEMGFGDDGLPPPPPPPAQYAYQFKLFDIRGLTHQISAILRDYKGWISRNPGKASDIESFFKILAYLLPGRLRGNSTVLPELLYSTANVVTFIHDQILQRELELAAQRHQQQQNHQEMLNGGVGGGGNLGRGRQNGTGPATEITSQLESARRRHIYRIQACLSILEYFEVFLEVAARRTWGEGGRWIVVFVMQALKACLRSVLLFYFKVGLTRSPALPAFDRRKYQPNRVTPASVAAETPVIVLKHSGRVIRKLNASPPLHSRDWSVPELPLSPDSERNLSPQTVLAEVIHISRPLCHLISMGACGTSSWKPWLLSAAMDITSLYLHGDSSKLHRNDQVELQKRTLSLLLYLLRSPFYDQATKSRLISSLEGIGGRVPLIGNLFLLLAQAIPQWQGTYSYVWS